MITNEEDELLHFSALVDDIEERLHEAKDRQKFANVTVVTVQSRRVCAVRLVSSACKFICHMKVMRL